MQWFNLEDNVNLLGLIGAIAIVLATVFVVSRLVGQMKVAKPKAQLSEHSWDGIGEYKNPVPLGWAIVYAICIVWALWYMIAGYPVNSYSQIGEYNEEVAAANAKFEKRFANVDAKTLAARNFLRRARRATARTAKAWRATLPIYLNTARPSLSRTYCSAGKRALSVRCLNLATAG